MSSTLHRCLCPDDIHGLTVDHKINLSFILDFLMGLGIPFSYATLKSGEPFTVCIKTKKENE